MKSLLKKYGKFIESIEKSNEYVGDTDYWCYLKEPYETEYGYSMIHDSLEMIEAELNDIAKRYN